MMIKHIIKLDTDSCNMFCLSVWWLMNHGSRKGFKSMQRKDCKVSPEDSLRRSLQMIPVIWIAQLSHLLSCDNIDYLYLLCQSREEEKGLIVYSYANVPGVWNVINFGRE